MIYCEETPKLHVNNGAVFCVSGGSFSALGREREGERGGGNGKWGGKGGWERGNETQHNILSRIITDTEIQKPNDKRKKYYMIDHIFCCRLGTGNFPFPGSELS